MTDKVVLTGKGLRYFLDNREVDEASYRARYPLPKPGRGDANPIGGWPMLSDALSVHPRQVKDAEELCRSRGVPTEFTKGGRPKFVSRAHRKEVLKVFGAYDRDGGYGD